MDTVYSDAGQQLASSLKVFVRCDGACAPLLPALRTAIRNIDPNTSILSIHTLQIEIEGAFSSQEVLGFLSTLFAALAILLVAAGIYGILSYTLTRRTREMGIRIALGASAKDIAELFVLEASAIHPGDFIGLVLFCSIFRPSADLQLLLLIVATSIAFNGMMFLMMVRVDDPLVPRAIFGVLNTLLFFPSGAIYPISA